MDNKRRGNRFVVDFGDTELSGDVAEFMQANIQEAVLRTVAKLDLQGDVSFRLPPDLWGLILDGRFEGINDIWRGRW